MALSTTIAELVAKILAFTHTAPQPKATALEESASAPVEYVDRVTMQFHATQPFIDTEVLINTTVITDIDPELVQSSTVTAGVVKITTEELLALPGAQAFLDALAEAAHDKLAAERAALIDPPAPPPQPASAPFEPERPVLPSPLG